MKIGLDSYSYHLHLEDIDYPRDTYWFLSKVVEYGLDGCHLDPRHLCGWNEDLICDIGEFCSDNGLYLELGGGGFDYERLSRRLQLSSKVGARLLRTFVGGERSKMPEERLQEVINNTIESFKRLSGVAERVDVMLAIENYEDFTSEQIIDILDAVGSPYIGACVDNGNALAVWEDPVRCVETLIPYLVAVHLKDWRHWWEEGIAKREGCVFGQGDGRVADVYSVLRKANLDIPITLRIPTVKPDRLDCTLEEEEANVIKSIQFIRKLDAQLEKV